MSRTAMAILATVPLFALTDQAHHAYVGSDPAAWTHVPAGRRDAASPRAFHTYIGDRFARDATRIATDAAGNTFVTGARLIPASTAGFTMDVFVTKLDAAGTPEFTVTLGGKGSEVAEGIALDAAGNIVVAGFTTSPNFPLRNAWQPTSGSQTGFVTKLSADGSRILFSTYFGGAQSLSTVRGVAADPAGNILVTGMTMSRDFPAEGANGLGMGVPMFTGAFVSKLSAEGTQLLWSRLLVGRSVECGAGSSCFLSARNTSGVDLAVDREGNAYVAGNTNTTDLPTTPGALVSRGIGAWMAKFAARDGVPAYLTYVGSTNYVLAPFSNPANSAAAIAVDRDGQAVIAGWTSDPRFPATAGAYQPRYSIDAPQTPVAPPPDAFVLKLNAAGTAAVWGSYLGGAERDAASSIAVDAASNVWVTGTTQSTAFPNENGWTTGTDFLARFAADGSRLSFAARYPEATAGRSTAVDALGFVHHAGAAGLVTSRSPQLEPDTGIWSVANAAGGTLWNRVSAAEVVSIYGRGIGLETPVTATASNGFLPTQLGDLRVSFGSGPAPLLYAGPNQINAVVTSGVGGQVTVTRGAAATSLPIAVDAGTPEIFREAGGQAAVAVNQDGTRNSASNPAAPGSIVSIWVTGAGAVFRLAEGQIATEPFDESCCQVKVSGQDAAVLYGGAAPGAVNGVMQVNLRLPVPLTTDREFLSVTTGNGRWSQPALVHVRQP